VADPLKSTVQNSKEMKLSSIISRACNTQSRDETVTRPRHTLRLKLDVFHGGSSAYSDDIFNLYVSLFRLCLIGQKKNFWGNCAYCTLLAVTGSAQLSGKLSH
jgi:hypothetical protein